MNTDTNFIVDALRNVQVEMFDDPEANAAATRCNGVMARAIELGDTAKPLPISQQLGFVYDQILVSEAMIEMYIDMKDNADLLAFLPEGVTIYQVIATYRQSIAELREAGFRLRSQLGR